MPSHRASEARPIGRAVRARFPQIGRRSVIAVTLLCVAGSATIVFLLAAPDEPSRQGASVAALTVSTAIPKAEVWTNTLVASGTIAAWQEASIGTQIGGYEIRAVRVNVGDHVRAGQILAELNPDLLKAEEAQLIASQEQAEANRRRAASLKTSGAISDQDVLQANTTARSAAALLKAKRLQLRYTIVRAPDDGVISARPATLGAVAPVGQELFRLIRGNRLEWRGELTAAQLRSIRPGQRVSLALPNGRAVDASIRQIAPMLDDRSRLAIVYADILRGTHARAGMYATGRIVVGHSPASTVPASSIVTRDGRSYVIKVTGRPSAAKVVQRAVTIGRRQDDRVEVTQGLDARDRVVTTGADFLNDGDVVRVVAPRAPSIQP